MEVNPYKSPQTPAELSAAENEQNLRRSLFVFLGALTLLVWIASVVACVFAGALGAMVGLSPIGLIGASTVWHGLNPSKSSVRLLVVALVILAAEFILLVIFA